MALESQFWLGSLVEGCVHDPTQVNEKHRDFHWGLRKRCMVFCNPCVPICQCGGSLPKFENDVLRRQEPGEFWSLEDGCI